MSESTSHPAAPPARRFRRLRLAVSALLTLAAAAVTYAILLPPLIEHDHLLVLGLTYASFMVRTFSFHFGLALLPLAGLALVLRMKRHVLIALLLLAWTLGPTLWSWRARPESPAHGAGLSVMSINLLLYNRDGAAILSSIAEQDPDIILMQEYTPGGAEILSPALAARYPHRLEAARDCPFGEAIFSKLPFVESATLYPLIDGSRPARPHRYTETSDPQVRVVVMLEGREVVIQNVHLFPPVGPHHFSYQRAGFRWLSEWVARETRPIIIAGDFNAVVRSREVGLLRARDFSSALDEAGRGPCATWPNTGPYRRAPGIRIDHFLTRGLTCESARVGSPTGSDHLPIAARFSIAKTQ